MGVHEAADGVLTRLEADRLRARALELVAELDGIAADQPDGHDHSQCINALWRWAGSASVILAELARD